MHLEMFLEKESRIAYMKNIRLNKKSWCRAKAFPWMRLSNLLQPEQLQLGLCPRELKALLVALSLVSGRMVTHRVTLWCRFAYTSRLCVTVAQENSFIVIVMWTQVGYSHSLRTHRGFWQLLWWSLFVWSLAAWADIRKDTLFHFVHMKKNRFNEEKDVVVD